MSGIKLGDFVIGQIGITADDLGEENRSRIEVMPEGTYVHHQAGKMQITREHLAQLLADVNSRGDKIPLDYDHSFTAGQGSRAAGWFVRGSAEIAPSSSDPTTLSLYADVQWTNEAAASIRTGEYRFISPEWNFRWKDRISGKWVNKARLLAATLTNRPFFDEMGPVHLCDQGLEAFLAEGGDDEPTLGGSTAGKESTMDMKAIAEALGLAADAGEEEILAAIKAAQEKPVEETKPEGTPVDSAALAALVAQAAKGEEALTLLNRQQRDSAIEAAIREKRIAPAQKEHFEALWASNPEATAKLLSDSPAGSWEPIGSEGKGKGGEESKPVLATAGNHGALYGHNPPAAVTANGDSFPVDEQSRKLHVEALKLLEESGKGMSYTADDYAQAALLAASKAGIAL